MCEEIKINRFEAEPTKPKVSFCDAFLFVEAHAKEHGEKEPDYKHCANYDPSKAYSMVSRKENWKGFMIEKFSGIFK